MRRWVYWPNSSTATGCLPDYVLTHGKEFVSTVNSYLGMVRHFASYGLRRKVMMRVGKEWWRVAYFEGHIEKAVLKKRYRPVERKKREIRNEICN